MNVPEYKTFLLHIYSDRILSDESQPESLSWSPLGLQSVYCVILRRLDNEEPNGAKQLMPLGCLRKGVRLIERIIFNIKSVFLALPSC